MFHVIASRVVAETALVASGFHPTDAPDFVTVRTKTLLFDWE